MKHAALGLLLAFALAAGARAAEAVPAFVRGQCLDCHNAKTKEGGLDLTALALNPKERDNFVVWVKVHDRVQKGEMPPADVERPPAAAQSEFLKDLSATLIEADRARVAAEGRAIRRRMNRYEYENTLRDLLALPYLRVKDFLPEDSVAHGSNKVGESLDVSHVQMARYLSAAEFALRQAMVPQAEKPPAITTRYYAWDQRGLYKKAGPPIRDTFLLSGYDVQPPRPSGRGGGGGFGGAARPAPANDEEREKREKESAAILTSTFEPTEIQFNGFRAPFTARYRLTFSGFTIWMAPDYQHASRGHRDEPVSIYSDQTPAIYRKLGSFDVGPDPTVRTLDVWLMAGETIRPDAARLSRSRPPDFKNPLAEADGMPGVAFQWMEVEGPLFDEWPTPGHRLLFDTLPLENKLRPPEPPAEENTGFRRRRPPPLPPGVNVVSTNADADSDRLLARFLEAVYRRPAEPADAERFKRVIQAGLDTGFSFTDAMLAGYTAVLSSPAFLYFDERPGPLDDRALADRLAYFLWNTRPDDELLRLAEQGELHRPEILRREADRLLADPRSRQFVDAFLDFWLDLRMIEATSPDTSLYPDYDLDDLLVESMLEETQLFFAELVQQNRGVANLVDSDFSMLNERLASHYGIGGVEGVSLRSVPLPAAGVRGGLLTQGSVLKITANGTTTSPVVRGAWVMDRLLGKPPPPPPAAVPAVDPDVRGATTIRAQLEKHRQIETCNACHKNIDPAGLALENFDVMGAWRENYRSLGVGEPASGVGHNGLRFHFRQGPAVDASGTLADGRHFQNVRDLKQCLLADPRLLARNLTERLVVYATGAPIGFSDRPVIQQMLTRTEPDRYRVRDLIHEIIQSEMFLNK